MDRRKAAALSHYLTLSTLALLTAVGAHGIERYYAPAPQSQSHWHGIPDERPAHPVTEYPGGPPIVYLDDQHAGASDEWKAIDVSLQLLAYSNPARLLAGGFKCYSGHDVAPVLVGGGRRRRSTSMTPQQCMFTIAVQLSGSRIETRSAASVQPIHMDANRTSAQLIYDPTRTFSFAYKPDMLSATVLHTGIVRYAGNDTWRYGDGPWTMVADTFHLNMSLFHLDCADNRVRNVRLFGGDVGSVLDMKLCYSCTNGALGADCDLRCDFAAGGGGGGPPHVCTSAASGERVVCEYGDANGVTGCAVCRLGVKFADGEPACRVEADLTRYQTVGVPAYWRILALVAGALILAALVAWFAACCLCVQRAVNAAYDEQYDGLPPAGMMRRRQYAV